MSEPKKRAPWISPSTPEPFCEWCGGSVPKERLRDAPAARSRYCSDSCWSECIDEQDWRNDAAPPEEDEEE